MTTDCSFREETLEDGTDYRELASQSPLATAFHRPEWLAAVQDITGESVRLLRVLQGRETTAILPHVHARWGPIRVLLSPPSGLGMQYLGPLIPEWGDLKQDKREARLNALAEAIRNHMRERRIRFCRVRCAPGLEDARAFQNLALWQTSTASVTGVAQPEEVPTLTATLGVKGHRPVVGTWDCKHLLYAFAVVSLVAHFFGRGARTA